MKPEALAFCDHRDSVIIDGLKITHIVIERIIAKTEFSHSCWLWTGYTRSGYGSLSVHDTEVRVPRIALGWKLGFIPKGLSALHTCDIKRCWCPDHLFAGTQAQNVLDMRAKGRGANPPIMRGENNPLAHLSDERVAHLRARAEKEKQRDVAREFGVSQSTVWRIKHLKVRA